MKQYEAIESGIDRLEQKASQVAKEKNQENYKLEQINQIIEQLEYDENIQKLLKKNLDAHQETIKLSEKDIEKLRKEAQELRDNLVDKIEEQMKTEEQVGFLEELGEDVGDAFQAINERNQILENLSTKLMGVCENLLGDTSFEEIHVQENSEKNSHAPAKEAIKKASLAVLVAARCFFGIGETGDVFDWEKQTEGSLTQPLQTTEEIRVEDMEYDLNFNYMEQEEKEFSEYFWDNIKEGIEELSKDIVERKKETDKRKQNRKIKDFLEKEELF